LGGVNMAYRIRIYCHTSYEVGSCEHNPPHPFVLPQTFPSIRAANDRGGETVGERHHDDLEWEVIDQRGEVVC
jgi:hypothetical protein